MGFNLLLVRLWEWTKIAYPNTQRGRLDTKGIDGIKKYSMRLTSFKI